jgi:integrase
MANKRVKIYESVKVNGRWTSVSVEIPKLKPDNTLYLKDGREGKFRISWYEGTRKQWHPTTCRTLGEALKVKAEKEWFLQNQSRPGVQDPTAADARHPIAVSVELYVDSLTHSKRTKSAYGHAVREFAEWNASLKNGSKKTFVEEIDKAHMARFFDYLVDDEPENDPYTAALKLLRVNAFIRTTLNLEPGKGPIKKSDYRRELKSGQRRPEIYTREELKMLFEAMTPEEEVLFLVFLKTGLRKREVMFLEEDDLIVDRLAPGRVKRQIRVTNKPRLGFMTKNGKTRFVSIDRDLTEKLLALKATKRPSRLLFGTANGLPDYHMLDTLRSIARRAGIEPSRCWLHKFRSTCATNWARSKRLGGEGHDIGVVREWLGHDDYKSIESYFSIAREEELIEAEEPTQANTRSSGGSDCVEHTTCFGCRFDRAEVRSKLPDGSQIVYCPQCGDLACEDGGNRAVVRKVACPE